MLSSEFLKKKKNFCAPPASIKTFCALWVLFFETTALTLKESGSRRQAQEAARD